MSLGAPVLYVPSVEAVHPDEGETVAELNATFNQILTTTAEAYGRAVRSVHAKAHGILQATLTVKDGLPPELAQGLFATAGEHRCYIRLSTNAGDLLPDAVSLPRGMALKVLDVPGERLPDAAGGAQDFVMVNSPVFPSPSADMFLRSLKLLAKTTDRMEGAKVVLSSVLRGVNKALEAVGMESPKVQALGGAPNVDPLGETYYSVTAFRYGDYIAKFAVVPVSPDLTVLRGSAIEASGRPDAIRETVQTEMQGADGVWEFRVQLCRDLDVQPVEDPTVLWEEEHSPYQTVAILHARAQDSWEPAQVERVDEAMRFSVWTGLAAHRPLGNINRARKATYEHSAAFRARTNGCPIHEPG
jgi:hypothetical protein